MVIFLLGIYIVLSIILAIVGAFFGNIIFFDSILLAALSGLLCHILLTMHPAFCLLIGIAVFLLLFWLQHTSVGFWIIGGIMSLQWASVFGGVAYSVSGNDQVWRWVVFGLALILMGGLHFKARDNSI